MHIEESNTSLIQIMGFNSITKIQLYGEKVYTTSNMFLRVVLYIHNQNINLTPVLNTSRNI